MHLSRVLLRNHIEYLCVDDMSYEWWLLSVTILLRYMRNAS